MVGRNNNLYHDLREHVVLMLHHVRFVEIVVFKPLHISSRRCFCFSLEFGLSLLIKYVVARRIRMLYDHPDQSN